MSNYSSRDYITHFSTRSTHRSTRTFMFIFHNFDTKKASQFLVKLILFL